MANTTKSFEDLKPPDEFYKIINDFISDILRTQEDFSKKIVGIILFCIFISYISNYFLEKYFKGPFYNKILIVLGILIFILLIY